MTSTQSTHRKRSSNFTKDEELLLLEEVEKFKGIVECKMTNRLTSTQKNDAWRTIANNFNAKSNQFRSVDQIRSKYENLKTKARKVASTAKKSFKRTGGGRATPPIGADYVTDAVLNIINVKTVSGLPSVGDCDCTEEVPQEPRTAEVALLTDDEMMNMIENSPVMIMPAVNEDPIDIGSIIDVPMTSVPRQPLAEKVQNAVNKEIITPQPVADNWSSYTPHKLKQPMNKRLRPNIPNPTFKAKEEYYKAKTRYVEQEILLNARRVAMEEENHAKRQMLLDVQIELTKKQIQNC